VDFARYVDLFLAESVDHLVEIRRLLSRLRDGQSEAQDVRSMFRHVHCIKGMAATMGFEPIVQLAHAAEEILEPARDGARPTPEYLLSVEGALATMDRELARIRSQRSAPAGNPSSAVDSVSRTARVDCALIDRALENLQEVTSAHRNLARILPSDCDDSVRRELDRAEASARDLSARLAELRLAPFDSCARRLALAVRDAGERLGRRVELRVIGGEIRADRSVLDDLMEALVHVVRNAVVHGIEPPEDRVVAGKPEQGLIGLTVRRRHDAMLITVSDDGRGFDVKSLRSRAVSHGTLSPEDAGRLGDDDALLLSTISGISTSSVADTTSGRGVGLDVLHAAVADLGGTLTIRSEPARGTRVEMSLPSVVAGIRALLVRCAGGIYAVPASAVRESVEPMPPWPGERALDLRRVLGSDASRHPRRRDAGVILDDRNGTVVIVEDLLGDSDVLVRPLDPPLRSIPLYTGSCVLEDGSLALVLDPDVLASFTPSASR